MSWQSLLKGIMMSSIFSFLRDVATLFSGSSGILRVILRAVRLLNMGGICILHLRKCRNGWSLTSNNNYRGYYDFHPLADIGHCDIGSVPWSRIEHGGSFF